MRLTLRTLLAWMDDTLEPDQVREIGKQVAESPFAQELSDRIDRVTRQRRLTVPSSSGPDATDPNIVAGYLDNDLDPDAVAEFEKRCLTSDVNLAEAASVHQILSLLGQKVKVPDEARTRMYQLVKGREAIATRRAAVDAAGGEGAGDQADPALGRPGAAEAALDRAVRPRRGLPPPDRPVELGGLGEPDRCRRRRSPSPHRRSRPRGEVGAGAVDGRGAERRPLAGEADEGGRGRRGATMPSRRQRPSRAAEATADGQDRQDGRAWRSPSRRPGRPSPRGRPAWPRSPTASSCATTRIGASGIASSRRPR